MRPPSLQGMLHVQFCEAWSCTLAGSAGQRKFRIRSVCRRLFGAARRNQSGAVRFDRRAGRRRAGTLKMTVSAPPPALGPLFSAALLLDPQSPRCQQRPPIMEFNDRMLGGEPQCACQMRHCNLGASLEIPVYKKDSDRGKRLATEEGCQAPPRGDLMPWRLSA
jgi:hypothetical protein